MAYIVNDALDELLDLVGAWFWPEGDEIVDQAQALDMPLKPRIMEVAQRLRLALTDEQIKALQVRASLRRLSVSTSKLQRVKPRLALSSLVQLDNMRSDGLLGRLVAQYWIGARTRAFYQTRCGALSFDDDSPTWKQRKKQLITLDEKTSRLKDPKWFGVALENKNFLDRYDGGNSKSTKWRRRYSLESTFSNWSAPPWFYWVYEQWFGENHGQTVWDSPGRWGGKLNYYQSEIWATKQEIAPVLYWPANHFQKSKSFLDGNAGFGEMTACLPDAFLYHGYKEYISSWDMIGSYSQVGTGPRIRFGSIPWRTMGKHVSRADRRAATYRIKPVLGTLERTQEAVTRYYSSGYYLVRTALDIILARDESPSKFPGFEAHCEWWCIACPSEVMRKRMPDLSAIGGGVVGLADVPSSEIVRYVMDIAPKPGTIEPWADKGPLWTWPITTGHMQCLPVPLQFKKREQNETWGTIAQYILSIEVSMCANMASGVVNTAIDAVVDQALALATEWLADGVSKVMAWLESEVGSAAWDGVRDLVSEVSSFASNISRFADAEKLVGEIAEAANLPKSMTQYLDAAVDGVPIETLNNYKDTAQSQIDSLRRQWDWADDLIGSAASMGSKVKEKLNSFPG